MPDDVRITQLVLPNRPQVGDSFLSHQWTDAVSNQVERMSLFRGDIAGGLEWHYCKLDNGALLPSGMDGTYSPDTIQNVVADVWGLKNDGTWVDTGHDITLTNRSRGYYYEDSFVQVIKNPQSGEWHIVYPAGDKVIGKTDGALSAGGTATLSIYSWNGASWADTTHNITIRDVFQWTVSASKFVCAQLWDYQNLWIPIAAEC